MQAEGCLPAEAHGVVSGLLTDASVTFQQITVMHLFARPSSSHVLCAQAVLMIKNASASAHPVHAKHRICYAFDGSSRMQACYLLCADVYLTPATPDT